MNKKLIIPIVLCAIIIIALIRTCSGPSKKVQLTWEAVPSSSLMNDSIDLKVYVENSGSMDAYMCDGSNLKDAVYDYVSDLKRLCTSTSLFYINSRVIPYRGELNSFIKDLTPTAFARAGGDRSNTDLMEIFKTILKEQDTKTVTMFVSDCILDLPQNALDFLGNCQVSIKNVFNDARANNPYLGVEIIKLESKFEGYWYCAHNKEYLSDVKRPYYIWLIGDQRYLAKFNEEVPAAKDIMGGIQEYCAFAPTQTIPFTIDKNTYVVNNTGIINVQLIANLNGSLQDDDVCTDINRYKTANPAQVSIVSINKITNKSSAFSHVIGLEINSPQTLKHEEITFSYPYLAEWVSESDDITGTNVKENLDKTTGLGALIKGVAEAYKNSIEYGTMPFELKNK